MPQDLRTEWPSPSAPIPSDLPGDGSGAGELAPALEPAARAVDRLSADDRLDAVVDRLRDLVDRIPAGPRRVLEGRWLGHPLHPALTDLPIGFWTGAMVVDLVGGKRAARAATVLVGLGVASAVPTLAAGWADWTHLSRSKQRVGVVHAASNGLATFIYAQSFSARRFGSRGRGIFLSFLGAGVATAGAYLGGHLAFGEESREVSLDGAGPR